MKQIMVVHYVVVVFLLNTEYKIDGDGGTEDIGQTRQTEKEEESEMNKKRWKKNAKKKLTITYIYL